MESSTKLDKNYTSKINGTDLGDQKPYEGTNGSKLTIDEVGRQIHEGVMSLLKRCDDILMYAVVKNIDIHKKYTKLSTKLQMYTRDIAELESRIVTAPEKYSESFFTSTAQLKIEFLSTYLLFHYTMHAHCLGVKSGNCTKDADISDADVEAWSIKDWDVESFISEDLDIDQIQQSDLRSERLKIRQHDAIFKLQTPLYNQYNEDLNYIKEKFERESNLQYVQHVKKYTDYQLELTETKDQIAKKKTVMRDLSVLSNIHNALSTGIVLIVGKLKSAVRSYQEIVSKLQCRVIIQETGDVVENPYETNSLTGMLEILKNEYVKANLVQFKHRLLDVLNFRLTKNQMDGNPFYGIQAITQKINVWKSMGLFAYLNEDIFWTVCFLRMYDNTSDIYQKALAHSMEFIYRMENEDIGRSTNLLYQDMPIFTDLFEWINKVYTPAIEYTQKNGSNGGGNGNKSNGSTSNNPQQQRNKYRSNYHSNEWAYIGVDNGIIKNLKPAEAAYDREVTRKDNVFIEDAKGNRHLYTATAQQCQNCSTLNNKHPNPCCYRGQCRKCKFYGHNCGQNGDGCRQTNVNK